MRLLRNLGISAGLAFVVPAVMWCFNPNVSQKTLLRMLAISAIYSNSVGLLFCLFMDQIWIYSNRLSSGLAWTFRFLMCFAMATVGTMIGTALIIAFRVLNPVSYWTLFWDGYRFALLITFGLAAVLALYETMKHRLDASNLQLKQKELERERAMKLVAEATLASLESRVHPHFLFNAINSVSSLIPEDPAKAERLLGQIADLLRFSLEAANAGLVPLEREARIVEGYLEIEKARFGNRLRYEVNWGGNLNVLVPPLSIQTLVENSVKHSIAIRREGGFVSAITKALPGGGLQVEVTDDGNGFGPDAMSAGHGLANLDARLKVQFGEGFGVSVSNDGAGCHVRFSIPEAR